MRKKYNWRMVCGKDKWNIIVLLLVTASLIGMAAYSASMIAAILVNLIVYEKNIDTHNLKVLIGAFCASFCLIGLLRKITLTKLVRIREKIEEKIFEQFLEQSILESDYDGKLISMITEDKNKIVDFIENQLSELIESIVISMIMGGIVLHLDRVLFFCILICSVISASSYIYAKKIESCEKERLVKVDEENKSFLELFRMIEILNFHKFSWRLLEQHRKTIHACSKQELKKQKMLLLFDAISYLCNIVRELIVIFYGSLYANMNIGMVIATLNMTSFFSEVARELGNYRVKSTECSTSIERMIKLLENETETTELPIKQHKVGKIRIENLSFQYENGGGLRKLSCSFEKNKINVVIGENGAGKTTLIKILCGLLIPQTGEIYFDSERQRNVDLRQNTAYVDQNNILLEGTILENITGYEEVPDRNKVEQLFQKLNLNDWISSIDGGLDHILNSEVLEMSGGQRQRLSIARALYKNSPVLIMDEPTASLDEENKQKMWEVLEKLKEEKLLIIVTHDKKLLKYAEQVQELKTGYLCK